MRRAGENSRQFKDELAARLRWNLDRLNPGIREIPLWAETTDSERNLYRDIIEDLSSYGSLWRSLIKPPDDN